MSSSSDNDCEIIFHKETEEVLEDADSGPDVVERKEKENEAEEEAAQENVVPHSTKIVDPQQMDSAEDDGVGGESEGEEESGMMGPQYWQRKFDNLRGQFIALPPPSQDHFPVSQQPMPPALPHPFAYPRQQWYGNIPFPSTFPSNGPQFGDYGGFSGLGPQFGHAPSQGPSTSAMKTPDTRVRPTPKGKRKTLKEQLADLKQKLEDAQGEITNLNQDFSALQGENAQKDVLIEQLQNRVRQSEEVIGREKEENKDLVNRLGDCASDLTEVTDKWTASRAETARKNVEIERLKGELDAEKKKNEATGNQMKNFKEDKEKNEKELKDALLKTQEKNSEQVREIEDLKKVNQKIQDGIKKLEEEEKNLIESYDKMNAEWEKKVTDMEETHRKKLEEMTGEYQSALEGQKKENEELMKERDELKKNKAKLEVAKRKLDEEKRNLEETLIDQVTENKRLEMDRDAGKRKNKDLIDDHAMKMDDLVRDHQSLLEDLETRRKVLENERSELKKLNFDLEAAKEKLEEEKRILELKVQDQENEKHQLELERNAEKRKIKDMMDSHSTKLDDLVRKHQSVLFDQEKKKEGLENERDEAKKLNLQLEATIKKFEEEKEKLEGKLRDHENEKKKKLKMELETVSAELAEKDERRLHLVAELQKLDEKGEHGDSTLANKPDSPEDQQVRGQGDEDQQAPSTSNNRKSRRRGEAVDVTEPPARRQQPKVNYRQGTKGSSKEVEVKK